MPSRNSPQIIRGCHDILPTSHRIRNRLTSIFQQVVQLRGCQPVETPILEPAHIYSCLGNESDINTHETFYVTNEDDNMKSKSIVLRPEGTAGISRLVKMNNLTHPSNNFPIVRLWYCASMFRHERPQLGRLREFKQLGVELIGDENIHDDIETVELIYDYFHNGLGLDSKLIKLKLNCIGDKRERFYYNQALLKFFEHNDVHAKLSPQLQTKIKNIQNDNYIKILDEFNKLNRNDYDLIRNHPKLPLLKHFIPQSNLDQFQSICNELNTLNIPFEIDDMLVRGLDYYSGLVFEMDMELEQNKHKTICAGGRYGNIIDDVNGVGFAIGLERLEKVLQLVNHEIVQEENMNNNHKDLIIVLSLIDPDDPDSGADVGNDDIIQFSKSIVRNIRNQGMKCVGLIEKGSGKKVSKIVKKAGNEGCKAIIIVGDREVREGKIELKMLNTEENGLSGGKVQVQKVYVYDIISKLKQ